jgi:ribosome maturation factor RimP
MITVEHITELLEAHIRDTDIFIVEVKVGSGNAIRVHLDRPEGISIDECVGISRHLNGQFDRDVEDFSLEVSSPGIDAPFKVRQQYEKNLGRKVELLLTDGTRVEGKRKSAGDQGVVIKVKGRDKEYPMDEIKRAKAIISFN